MICLCCYLVVRCYRGWVDRSRTKKKFSIRQETEIFARNVKKENRKREQNEKLFWKSKTKQTRKKKQTENRRVSSNDRY